LADDRQKRKRFLTPNRPFVTLYRLNLSFRIQRNQAVTPFPFLVLKTPRLNPPTERVPKAQATAAVIAIDF
jgi:hypothetical protein